MENDKKRWLSAELKELRLMFRTLMIMGEKCDISGFDCGMVLGARCAGLSLSETAESEATVVQAQQN